MSNHPLAIVDRDGCVWPWDGQEENPYMLAAGSRYLFAQKEVDACKKAYAATLEAQAAKRQAVGTAKKVKEAVFGSGTPDPVYASE